MSVGGLMVTASRYLSAASSWDRFVQGPAVVGWLVAAVMVIAALVASRWIRRKLILVAAAMVGLVAVSAGVIVGSARRCDAQQGSALLQEVVGLTSVVEIPAVHSCEGERKVERPQWSSELWTRSAVERQRIVGFLEQHGLVDLDSSTSFTAVFEVYTIEVVMPLPSRKGEVVVKRARP